MESDVIYAETINRMTSWAGHSHFTNVIADYPGVSVYIAGGVVRDAIRKCKRDPKDFDLFLAGTDIDGFLADLGREGTMDQGPYGSPRWFPRQCCGQYADIIRIDRFYNGLSYCTTMTDALNQFDLTINSVAVELRTGVVLNPQNGIHDIQRRVVRAVRFDIPDLPISESVCLSMRSALWHRIKHYAVKTRFTIDSLTSAWLEENSSFEKDRALFYKTFN